MKPIVFIGDSRERVRSFPDGPRYRAGVELRTVQNGFEPNDWKPMKEIGTGVREIRINDRLGAFRIIYVAALADCVLVLHAFQKKTQRTPQRDIDLAAKRLEGIGMETFDSVFDALEDIPSKAANLTARADLMIAIRERVRKWDIPQEQAAARLGLTRPRLNDLLKGKLEKFSLDALINAAAASGLMVQIRIVEPAAA